MPLQDDKAVVKKPRSSEALSDEAIDRLVRLKSGRATPADWNAFAAWRARDAAHEAAAAEAEFILDALGETRHAAAFRGQPRDTAAAAIQRGLPRMTRRAVLGGAVAAAAGVTMGSGVFGPVARLYSDYSTGVGGRRRVALPDGSIAYLNTASALSVDYSSRARRLALHAGEALFEVAKDSARPFIVSAADGETRAVGTIFAVRCGGADSDVVVSEGSVDVRCGRQAAVRVTAGERVAYGSGRIVPPVASDVQADTAWQRGKLIFNRRTLAEVVSELQRYRTERILIADDRLKSLRVTGVFDLDQPEPLLRTIAETTSAHILRLPFLTVIR